MKKFLLFIVISQLIFVELHAQAWHKFADFPENISPKDITANHAGTIFMLSKNNQIYYKKIDENWQKMNQGNIANATDIAVVESSNHLFVSNNGYGGIQHTSNFGGNWGLSFINTNNHTGFHETYNILSNIRSSNLIYASNLGSRSIAKFVNNGNVGQFKTISEDTNFRLSAIHLTSNQKLLIGSNQGVWMSINEANSFSPSGLGNLDVFNFSESQDGTVYALSKTSSGTIKLWKSHDNNYANWVELNLPDPDLNYHLIYYDQLSGNLWLANENSMFKTDSQTINWINTDLNLTDPKIIGFAGDPNGTMYAFEQERICLHFQNTSWETQNQGLYGEVNKITFDADNQLYGILTYYSNKISVKESIADEWINKSIPTDAIYNFQKMADGSMVLGKWNQIYRTSDGGNSFVEINLPDAFANQESGGIELVETGESGGLFLTHSAIQNKVFATHDLGENWVEIDLFSNLLHLGETLDGNYIGVFWGEETEFLPKLYFSGNQGLNWTEIENEFVDVTSFDLRLKIKKNRCFVQFSNKIYEVNIAQQTYNELTLPFQQNTSYDLQFSLNDQEEMFLINEEQDLYRSIDNAQSWENLGSPQGVSQAYLTSLAFGYDGLPFVIYSAYNSANTLQGIYYFGNELMQNSEFDLTNDLQIYPNPAKESFYLKTEKGTEIKLYDWSGKLVLHQIIQENPTEISIRSLPKGTYILKSSKCKSVKLLKL